MADILVIGESCLDIYEYGECVRLCPEAPVPIFKGLEKKNRKKTGGMAMNVYKNIEAIGASVDIITNKNWKTLTKTRYIDYRTNYVVLRADHGETLYGRCEIEEIDLNKYKCVVISDYNKGFLSEEDIAHIAKSSSVTFLDTKKILGPWANDASFIKINNYEFDKTKHRITKKQQNKMIITSGPDGCHFRGKRYKVPKVEIKDTAGAGDTFIAALASEYVQSANIEKSILFANQCATTVVQKKGISVI
jgi:D-beta-D-heptose 7-phosphate kinase/D-beta-D-heptose 1-phosphate adenosyltransferase